MKIAIAVHHFPPRYTGGAELRAYRTGKWLQDHGHEVRVVCVESIDSPKGGLTFEDGVYGGLPVRRLHFGLESAPDPFLWRYDNRWIGDHLSVHLAELAPDVLHLISGYMMSGRTLLAAEALHIPTVVSLTDFWFLCPRITLLRSNGRLCGPPFSAVTCAQCLGEEKRRFRYAGALVPGLMRRFWKGQAARIAQVQERMDFLRGTFECARAVISPSRFLRRLFVESGFPGDRIVYSRQGRDFDLTPEVLAKTPSDRLRIGYMGQIVPHKGVHTLIEAAGRLPASDVEVKIYGDATKFPRYVRRLQQMSRDDERVKWLGVYERDEISRVLQELDVVVVPSVWYENSPNTILEALAHRTPVVATKLGGMAELVEDGVNGLLFALEDASDLAGKLGLLVQDRGLLRRLGQECERPKSVDQEMAELLDVYEKAVSARCTVHCRGERLG